MIGHSTDPLSRYWSLRSSGELLPDPSQEKLVEALQGLWLKLAEEKRDRQEHDWWMPLGKWRSHQPSLRGLYIFGGVGRGKTMLLDIFFASAPVSKKRRVHFYGFTLEVHDRIHGLRALKGDPIRPVALAIAKDTTLLCFDEFQVTDVADAMILGRLFKALIDAGVVVVATSNQAPDELYEDGLQRERFLPFIALLKDRLDVFELWGRRDYRLARFAGRQVYFVPADDSAYRALERAFADATDKVSARSAMLLVQGHFVMVPRAAKGVAWFGFDELCAKPFGAADYLALCRQYHTFIVEGVPRMEEGRRDEAQRFRVFVDTLYEAHGNLIASAEARPQQIFTGSRATEFRRTVSRLMEMQSADYIFARHT